MPGILGFCGYADLEVAERMLAAMLAAMGDVRACTVDRYVGASCALARTDLGIVDPEPQPLWSTDGSVALVMAGEIYSYDGFSVVPPETGAAAHGSSGELLLAAYDQLGSAFVDHVNGSFAAAIWDGRKQQLLLITDHIGTYPLYYAQIGSHFVFGSGARAVAQAPDLPRSVNLAAIADLIAFEQVYGDKTLFAGVQHVPPGTILCFAGGMLSRSVYADFQLPEFYEHHGEDTYAEQWAFYTRQAVKRQLQGPQPLGVLLTGGLDSRSLLGMMAPESMSLVSMTFGQPACDDVRIAREVAGALGVTHKYFPLAPDYLLQQAANGVRITDGMKSCVHMNVLGPLEQLAAEAKVLYKGYLGGTIHGHVVTADRLAPMREETWFGAIFAQRNQPFPEAEWPELYSEPMLAAVQSLPRQSLRQALEQSHSTWWVDKDTYVDLYQEDVRFTSLGVELARSQALVRVPLADKDLLRFAVSVPPGYRLDKHYYKLAIARAFPDLAKIPVLPSGYPLANCFRQLRLRADEQLRWWLRNHGLSQVPMRQPRPYADYASWLRKELKGWVERILLSPAALERGYFKPDYLCKLVAAHMAGSDHARRLGVLLSIELWHQQFAG